VHTGVAAAVVPLPNLRSEIPVWVFKHDLISHVVEPLAIGVPVRLKRLPELLTAIV
jgi:hypothetical protein